MNDNYKHSDITSMVLKAFFNVYNELGYGFIEKVYENAMVIELRDLGLNVEQQVPVKVLYGKEIVGDYIADIVVNELVILELKAIEKLNSIHEVQLVNYLKATDIEVGLLLNFGKEPHYKRKVLSNE
ncbi:GxxExxY protein [Ancylomarina sp.]|uniref:GxxExxY protein n=1 Tax=Ancylomarina sp. TaxID=1970196 RepID=UPI0035674DD0